MTSAAWGYTKFWRDGIADVAEVLHLFVALVHRLPVREMEESSAVANKGFEGCMHGRPGSKRQVLLMDSETLAELGVPPGAVRENITTRGLDMKALERGQGLRIGKAVFEATVPCEPCSRMDEIRPGLQETLKGQRGWLCRVVEGGIVRRGDAIELVSITREALS
jgi:MOSC domain-containing protein YiiM